MYISFMNKKDLTAKQRKSLEFIQDAMMSQQRPPTLRELGKAMGVSVGAAQTHVAALRRKGLLQVPPAGYQARSTIPLGSSVGRRIPVLGQIPAGPLAQAFELAEDEVVVDPDLLPRGTVFGLNVYGDSMTGAGILEGDIILVRVQEAAEEGEIVVARTGDDATVKRLRKWRGGWYLFPENPAYTPIPCDETQILGKVVGLFRKF